MASYESQLMKKKEKKEENLRYSRISPRTSNQIRLKSTFKTKIRETSFQYPSVQLWNDAPKDITEAQTESQARGAIRKYVKECIPI